MRVAVRRSLRRRSPGALAGVLKRHGPSSHSTQRFGSLFRSPDRWFVCVVSVALPWCEPGVRGGEAAGTGGRFAGCVASAERDARALLLLGTVFGLGSRHFGTDALTSFGQRSLGVRPGLRAGTVHRRAQPRARVRKHISARPRPTRPVYPLSPPGPSRRVGRKRAALLLPGCLNAVSAASTAGRVGIPTSDGR